MKGGSFLFTALAVLALTACGDSGTPGEGGVVGEALQVIDETRVAELLSAEGKAALGIVEQGVRTEIAAYKAQYGQLPASYAELASLETARAAAVTVIADGLAEQLPFVRRETLEQVSAQFVGRAQQRIFEQIKGQEQSASAPEGQSR